MKKQAYISLMILSLFVAMSVTSVNAQSQAKLVANIPFEFVAGEKTMPAGEYTIRPVSEFGLRTRLLIRSRDGKAVTTVMVNSVQLSEIQKESKLVFNRYGDQTFLSQVWTSQSEYIGEVIRSKAEDRLAKKGAEREVVTTNTRQ